MDFTPCFLSTSAWALAVSTSSLKSTDATPAGSTRVGVSSRVMPMKPILTPPTVRTSVAGSSVSFVPFVTTFAASHLKSAPA